MNNHQATSASDYYHIIFHFKILVSALTKLHQGSAERKYEVQLLNRSLQKSFLAHGLPSEASSGNSRLNCGCVSSDEQPSELTLLRASSRLGMRDVCVGTCVYVHVSCIGGQQPRFLLVGCIVKTGIQLGCHDLILQEGPV